MKKLTVILVLLVSFFATFLSSAQDIKAKGTVKIRINGVTPEEKGRIDGVYGVSDDGKVNMPIIGKVAVAGLKYADASEKIADAYRNAKVSPNPKLHISPSGGGDFISAPVVVIGFVHKPGATKYIPGMTLINAIVCAGGAKEFANTKKVILMRGKQHKIYDIRDPNNKNILLNPGDAIEVPGITPSPVR